MCILPEPFRIYIYQYYDRFFFFFSDVLSLLLQYLFLFFFSLYVSISFSVCQYQCRFINSLSNQFCCYDPCIKNPHHPNALTPYNIQIYSKSHFWLEFLRKICVACIKSKHTTGRHRSKLQIIKFDFEFDVREREYIESRTTLLLVLVHLLYANR